MMYAVVFAGNPGKEYERTRHNAGWMFIPYLPCTGNAVWKEKFKGLYSQVQFGSKTLCLIKPHTFMNKIGESVQPCLSFFKLSSRQLIVVHDDLELPFGETAIKEGGGLGGHNGLRSVAQSIGSQEFFRLRIGVGRPPRGDVSAYVLSRFSAEEEAELPDVLAKAAVVLEEFIAK